jgi:hypothetical protein
MMWWRFWRWPRLPANPLVAMALLVRAIEHNHPDWTEIHIIKRNKPGGGINYRVLGPTKERSN